MDRENSFLSSQSQQPYYLPQNLPPPSPISNSNGFNLNERVSPSILLIIIILAIIFFISGLLHLLVRFLLKPPNRDPEDWDNVTALQGQLQQLFHLHDSGVDQTFIDALPIFNYKSIIGVKDPFDCAVCLCEFEGDDKLRLLPKCSHAFHMVCIDTWLLSHSTCPLCRANVVPDFSPNNHSCSAVVLVLESGSESVRENASERDCASGTINSATRANSHLGLQFGDQFGDIFGKSCEIQAIGDLNQQAVLGSGDKVVAVKLGKFRNVDGGVVDDEEDDGNINRDNKVDGRRCFSMGSFEYVMDENSRLQVPIRTPMKKKHQSKKPPLPLIPGHRPAMSEIDCHSRRDLSAFEPFKSTSNGKGDDGTEIGRSKRESFSISKIWQMGKKDRPTVEEAESSRRAFSFRFPVNRNIPAAGNAVKPKNVGSGTRRTLSQFDMDKWETEMSLDEVIHGCNSSEKEANPPSLARRTLFWLVGRQHKVVHSSFSPNV